MKRSKIVLALATAAIVFAASSANAAMITNSSGIWSDDTNWNTAAPTGSDDAVVSSGHTMSADSTTASYTGTLTLGAGARINASGGGSQNAWTGVSSITMNAGSVISDNSGSNHTVPAISLLGNAEWVAPFGASDWNTNDFGTIAGAFTWTTNGFNGHEFHYNAANTFSEYQANASDRHKIKVDAAGGLGTGDVHINQRGDQVTPNRSAELSLNVQDTIADTATLYINGPANGGGFAGNGINVVIVAGGVDEVVGGLSLWGTALPVGTYNGGDSTTDWLGGSGSITVVPEPATMGLLAMGGLALLRRRRNRS